MVAALKSNSKDFLFFFSVLFISIILNLLFLLVLMSFLLDVLRIVSLSIENITIGVVTSIFSVIFFTGVVISFIFVFTAEYNPINNSQTGREYTKSQSFFVILGGLFVIQAGVLTTPIGPFSEVILLLYDFVKFCIKPLRKKIFFFEKFFNKAYKDYNFIQKLLLDKYNRKFS